MVYWIGKTISKHDKATLDKKNWHKYARHFLICELKFKNSFFYIIEFHCSKDIATDKVCILLIGNQDKKIKPEELKNEILTYAENRGQWPKSSNYKHSKESLNTIAKRINRKEEEDITKRIIKIQNALEKSRSIISTDAENF